MWISCGVASVKGALPDVGRVSGWLATNKGGLGGAITEFAGDTAATGGGGGAAFFFRPEIEKQPLSNLIDQKH